MEKKPTKKAAAPKKTAAAKDISVPTAAAEVKTAVKRTTKKAVIDPFAEVVETASAKKSGAKTVKAKAATSPVKKAVKKVVKKAAAPAADVTAEPARARGDLLAVPGQLDSHDQASDSRVSSQPRSSC